MMRREDWRTKSLLQNQFGFRPSQLGEQDDASGREGLATLIVTTDVRGREPPLNLSIACGYFS